VGDIGNDLGHILSTTTDLYSSFREDLQLRGFQWRIGVADAETQTQLLPLLTQVSAKRFFAAYMAYRFSLLWVKDTCRNGNVAVHVDSDRFGRDLFLFGGFGGANEAQKLGLGL
jgi:hypothetical protein